MLAICIENKGNARHFWNCVWLTDGRGAGGQGQTSQTKIYEMLPINIEKQRKRPPFFNYVWRTDGRGASGRSHQTKQANIYYRIVYFYDFKCFRLVLKSKGHARLFSKFNRKRTPFLNCVWLPDGRGAGGQGQTSQTEIYYRIVYFYCFKCFRIVLKSKGDVRLF